MRIAITGNTSGIGRMLEERLSAQGHTIIGLSRSGKLTCDVSDYDSISECARYILDAFDGLDAVIACAGTQGEVGKLMNTDPKEWEKTVKTNLMGTYNTIHALYPLMDLSRRPKIVCFAGGGAAHGRPFFSAYASAKAATVRLVETFALEQPELDINIIAPGAIKTNIANEAIKKGPEVIGNVEYEKALKQIDGGDDPEPMLQLVEWLISPKSDGVSGRYISAKWDDWKNAITPTTVENLYKLRRTES